MELLSKSNVGMPSDRKVLGNPESFFGNAIVGSVDLLGFGNEVLRNWGDHENSAIFRFLRIKGHAFVRTAGQACVSYGFADDGTISDPGSHLNGALYRPRVHTFSDSFVVSVALPENICVGDIVLANFCINCHLCWLRDAAVLEGFAVRGAVEFGGVYWSKQEISGPALVNAYHLESRMAKSARIVLGPLYLDCLRQLSAHTEFDIFDALAVSGDGLVQIRPDLHLGGEGRLNEYIQQLRSIEASCSESKHRTKYAETIAQLCSPLTIRRPTAAYISELLQRFRYGD